MDEEQKDDGQEPPAAGESADAEKAAGDTAEEGPKPAEALERELDELRGQHLRLRAEFDNFRKRTAREQQQIRDRAGEHLIQDLLPAIDDLERACESIPVENENGAAVKEGIELVLKSFRRILGRHGLQEIPALSQPFDPNLHEAVMAVETEDHPGDTVIEEVQKGYTLGDRVIRPSRVVVAKPVTRDED